jgi:cell division protein FtsB
MMVKRLDGRQVLRVSGYDGQAADYVPVEDLEAKERELAASQAENAKLQAELADFRDATVAFRQLPDAAPGGEPKEEQRED